MEVQASHKPLTRPLSRAAQVLFGFQVRFWSGCRLVYQHACLHVPIEIHMDVDINTSGSRYQYKLNSPYVDAPGTE